MSEYPLVTFALFAYNQEQYIRDAVEGALAQDYPNLEIILSDDCSTDGTFSIIAELAKKYGGPHKVLVRRNAFNLGTALHVQSVFHESNGALIVVAGGDDISTPDRVSKLCGTWVAAGSPEGLLHSGRESFREGGSRRTFPAKRTMRFGRPIEGFAKSYWLPAAAPTCAYTRGVFERFPALMGGSIIEDAPLQFRAALIGSVIPCDELLVRQRLHPQNSGTGHAITSPGRWNRLIQSKVVAFRTMQRDLAAWSDIDAGLRVRIEGKILSVLHSASRLMLPESRALSRIDRVRIATHICFSPAIARTFRLRVEYALSFLGFRSHISLKNKIRHWLSARSGAP